MPELGINLLGVQEARTAAGSRVVDGYVVLASGAEKGTLGCELWADTEKPYASVDGKEYSSANLILWPSTLPHESWRSE